MALFGRILGKQRRTSHHWVSGHVKEGKKREHERQILAQITEFKHSMDRQGIVFREDRDAWEAYWDENPKAHKDLSGDSIDEALGEQAYRVFRGYWHRINKSAIVRFEGDGVVAHAPTLLTIGKGDDRARANPLELLKLTDPEQRALGAERLLRTIERRKRVSDTYEKRTAYLERLVDGLQGDARVIENPETGEMIIQGILPESMEEEGDDDAE